jgi:hypothetical protein
MAQDEIVDKVFTSVIDQLRQQSRKAQYVTNPSLWAKDVLGIEPWSKQQDILKAVQENDHVAVRSCHGSGKSYIASIIAAWWIAVHPIGEAIVVTTAPTYHQVHSILWEDIRKHHINANQRFLEGLAPMGMPGKIKANDEWKSDTGVVLGFGRKPADNNDHGFQGIHRRYVLVIVDESCGIRDNLFTAVEAITTTENSRILAIGNPDDPAAHFAKFFLNSKEGSDWINLDVSAFDSPNFTREHEGHYKGCEDPECLRREYAKRWDRDRDTHPDTLQLLPNHEWVEQRRRAWGTDSPLWLSKVLGQFPLQSINTLFSRETLNKGLDASIKPLRTTPVILGVDLARFGPDYSTIYKNEGGKVRLVDFWGGKADETEIDGVETAMRVHTAAQRLGATEVRIDTEGLGGPISDQIRRLSDGSYQVIAMRGSMASPDHWRWVNARAYWYDTARQLMLDGKVDIDPTDTRLENELEQIQYHFKNRYSSLQIESKEEMDKRGVKSPDFSDAFAYAVADMTYVLNDPMSQYNIGDRISMSTSDFLGFAAGTGFISPL